ncbi:hypothetical protein CMO89_01020 [Candidatus Woesearchaeota archaeon]|nr:hypothetical protein [Candidatus Woesearchaeota archaeon]|tara:strand:+ start:11547 stop:11957 length:411 start_codon:yes stop_codon:yes gene_type:complete
MSLRMPESMEECIYFTKRTIDDGRVTAWVFKENCSKCGKALMGKPIEKGKVKIRAKEYVCPECGYTVGKEEYEETLTANISYTCPHCSFEGEIQVPFKRKKIQLVNEETGKKKVVDALRFQCEKCGEDIDITKKMK